MADTKFLDKNTSTASRPMPRFFSRRAKASMPMWSARFPLISTSRNGCLEYRLKAFEGFSRRCPSRLWTGSFVSWISLLIPITPQVAKGEEQNWNEVPEAVKDTFQRLGIPEAEQKYLSGVTTQYESEVVYHNMLDEVQKKGVIFLSTDMALQTCPELMKKYFGTVVPSADNKFAALNSRGLERWLVHLRPERRPFGEAACSPISGSITRKRASSNGLSSSSMKAPTSITSKAAPPRFIRKNRLHAAVVEIVVLKGAHCRYTTVQNWSNNIVNLVTQRALVEENGLWNGSMAISAACGI
jgi:Fe-S cluster assembly protein SufB